MIPSRDKIRELYEHLDKEVIKAKIAHNCERYYAANGIVTALSSYIFIHGTHEGGPTEIESVTQMGVDLDELVKEHGHLYKMSDDKIEALIDKAIAVYEQSK